MHELPKGLTNSLRSYRGSIYGDTRRSAENGATDDRDVEKGLEDYGDKTGVLNAKESSLILHPTRSMRALAGARKQEQAGGSKDAEKKGQTIQFDDQNHGRERPQVDTGVEVAKKQPSAQTAAKNSIFDAPPVKDTDPAADRLAADLTPLTEADFYELMGMHPPSHAGQDSMRGLAKTNGLFADIVKHLRSTQRKYKVFAVAVYVFLVLQLAISAVFIILGSLRNVDTHITIAVLGAVSTIIAGGLALMQGQGLPNRLRMARDSLRSVIFEAEELYWDFRSGRSILYKDVKKVREDYLRVLEEQKKNHPDAWVSVPRDGTGGGTQEKKR